MLARPGMFVMHEDFSTIAAFVRGMDMALDGQLLDGFDRWLRDKYKIDPSPLGWEAYIYHVAQRTSHAKGPTPETEVIAFMSEVVRTFAIEKYGVD